MPESLNEKTLLDLFKAIIRYTASGFIFIYALKFFMHDTSIWEFTTDKINWSLVIVAGICGIILYSFHLAVLDDIFYRFSLIYLIRIKSEKEKEYYLPKEFKSIKDEKGKTNYIDLTRISFSLTTHRLARPGTNDKVLLAILVFIYTSSYSLLSLTFFYTLKNIIHFGWAKVGFDKDYLLIAALGLALLLAGFRLDLKITKRELYIVKESE